MSEGDGHRVGQRRFNRDASKELVLTVGEGCARAGYYEERIL